ncbi:DMT family transporter [Aestuariibacter halophilus]|uniref:DMT family transporter n=1 Tax=Fluctibacter halophilus TaxID=226011 RepID=A0ABS8G671_9ALTE|nr:DMT family transporter [Aestuariibacter halophilus]MCC2616092.1 DMT family transporter [Aestuariibacter halophilus]
MTFALLAFIAGTLIAFQASVNSQLGVVLNNPTLATAVVFCLSATVSVLAVGVSGSDIPTLQHLRNVPWFLWLGGLMSALGVGLFYYLIPKMGVGLMMSYALTGQLLLAMLVSHFGWFGLPVLPLSPTRIVGLMAMITGIILINR